MASFARKLEATPSYSYICIDHLPSNLIFVTTLAEWRALAAEAILNLLDRELAVIWPEVEAKLEPKFGAVAAKGIDPHHLQYAREQLRQTRVIEEYDSPTRGGH